MSEITNFFFDPTYHQITAINMHTILLIMLHVGILIGLYTKKLVSSTVTVIIFVVAIVVTLLMNFLVRWLCRNDHANIAWLVIAVLFLLHVGTGYNIISSFSKLKNGQFSRRQNYNMNNFDSNYDFNNMDYTMQSMQSMQSMPPSMQSMQSMPPSMQSMPPSMQSMPQNQPQNYKLKNFNNSNDEE
jgi:hypothetical protein